MTRKALRFILPVLILITAILSPLSSFAYKVPAAPKNGGVYDDAGVMDAADIEHILTLNDRLDDYCGGQIAVAVFTGLGGADIATYANDVFNEWGVGSKTKNNGVLLLMSIADADYWVVQGKGIEDDITSGELSLILDDELEPYFAKEEYSKGAVSFADAVYQRYASVYGFSSSIPQAEPQVQYIEGYGGGLPKFSFSGLLRFALYVFLLYLAVRMIASLLRSCCGDGDGCGCWSCCLPMLCCGGDGGYRGSGGGWRGPPPGGFGGTRGGFGGTRGSFGGGVGRTSGGSSFGGSHHGGFGGGSSRGGGAGKGRH